MNFQQGDLKNRLLWCTRAQWGLLATLLIVGGGIYLLGIRPASTRLDQLRTRYAVAQDQFQQDQDRAKTLPNVELEIQQLRKRVERFDKTLPKQQELASFINDVTRISQQASLKKLAWNLDAKPHRSDRLTELPIRFSFAGDFQSGIVEFLRATEDLPRLTRVRKLDLKSSDARDGQVTAELTMDLYFGEQ
jgi:Tfp pilus assembly protein PilO